MKFLISFHFNSFILLERPQMMERSVVAAAPVAARTIAPEQIQVYFECLLTVLLGFPPPTKLSEASIVPHVPLALAGAALKAGV